MSSHVRHPASRLFWRSLLCLTLACAQPWAALAQSDNLGNRPNSPIHAFGQTFASPLPTIEQQSRMVVGLFSKLSHFPHHSRQGLSHVQHILLIF